MNKHKRLSLRELAPIIADYQRVFPHWQKVGKDTLCRVEDPIAQCLWLDRLRTGEYRPTFSLQILTAPSATGSAELCQLLPSRVRSLTPAAHKRLFEEVIAAIKHDIFPPVDKALDPYEIFTQYEKIAVPKGYEAYTLATLAAYLGQHEKCVFWKQRFEALLAQLGGPRYEHDQRAQSFLEQLVAWLSSGCTKDQLDAVVKQEKIRRGLWKREVRTDDMRR